MAEATQEGLDRLALSHVSKSFYGTEILHDVSIGFRPGEIHALVGENGAGKSTVGKIAGGFYSATKGEILHEGHPVGAWNPVRALEKGVAIMHQELQIVTALTVAQNVFLGIESLRFGLLKHDDAARAAEIERICGFELDPNARAGDLALADQQKIEIMRALARNAQVIVLDEPTSSLTFDEIERLHATMKRLRDDGRTLIYITHFLDHVLEVSDRVTILRDGSVVRTADTASETKATLIGGMLGGGAQEIIYPDLPPLPGPEVPPLLEVKGLVSGAGVKGADLIVRPGEVVGLVGLVGSGRSEIARAIFGADPSEGTVRLNGEDYADRSPEASIARGVAFVPEDRRSQGLVLASPVRPNITMASLPAFLLGGFLRRRKELANVTARISEFSITPPSMDGDIRKLSGGNQQKVLLAKWVTIAPSLIILDEPSRGVDIGARRRIHDFVIEQAASGKAVLLISSELEEVLGLSHRAYLVHEGRTVKEISPPETTMAEVLNALFQVESEPS
ncbi:monosaccharide ABC transporter ATP-binding protein, CUT2 family [Mesorhizobium australicum]|uniref:Monosaccharide ABC transporter ATP-binding protein, CUT2 family n=1 Tax=Mesorhizobium australicum TaxID=536018 RepID=A0A1X7PXE7_9HYPH|nr:monosaccharide ABC transporter ATP-binding protein, CUT2 family [Mesorhizobium australicum]